MRDFSEYNFGVVFINDLPALFTSLRLNNSFENFPENFDMSTMKYSVAEVSGEVVRLSKGIMVNHWGDVIVLGGLPESLFDNGQLYFGDKNTFEWGVLRGKESMSFSEFMQCLEEIKCEEHLNEELHEIEEEYEL